MSQSLDNKKEVLQKSWVVFGVFCLCLVAVVAKVFYIGMIKGDYYRARGKELHVKPVEISAERGNILADGGELLATSMPFFDIRFDPLASKQYVDEMRKKDKHFDAKEGDIFKKNIDSLSWYISKYLRPNLSQNEIKSWIVKQRNAEKRYVLLARDVPYTKMQQIKKFPLFRLGSNKSGLIIETQPQRVRPYGDMALRTIGYTRDTNKMIGLEGYYDKDLRGEAGKRMMQFVRPSTWIPVNDLTEIEPRNGKDVHTTLNVMMQDIAKSSLEEALIRHDGLNGCAIVMETKTGAIKAIANLQKENGAYKEIYNYALAYNVEPGSTFKLASVMAMLEDGKLDLDYKVNVHNGTDMVSGRVMKDAEWHRHTEINIQQAFEISSNIGISKAIVASYGQNREGSFDFVKRLKQFHLDQPTGIRLEGETNPLVKTPYNLKQLWSRTSLAWMAHGYETRFTPLQLLTFYNAVANGGKMMRPYLVSGIWSEGTEEKSYKPEVIDERIASESTIKKAKIILEGVVKQGTAKKFKTDLYAFAGKTGTASLDYGGLKRGRYRASFIGYFPAEDPQYSIYVMITEPKAGGFHGSEVALPVFRAIADKITSFDPKFYKISTPGPEATAFSSQLPANEKGNKEDYMGVFNRLGVPVYTKGEQSDYVVTRLGASEINLVGYKKQKTTVPDVRGMGLRDALYAMETNGLKVEINGYGKVSGQDIEPGTKVSGQKVLLTLQ